MSAPRRPCRKFRRGLVLSLFAPLVLAVAGAVFELTAELYDAYRYPPPGTLVDVGGYRLHLHCVGEGGPTVILTRAGFLAIGPDGLPVKDFTPPEHIPDALSRAVCAPSGELVFFDSANARIHAIARNQELKFVIGGQAGDKPLPRDAALLAPADGALDAVGELYVLEGKTGAVKRYSHRGEFRRVVVRRNSMDASVRLSRPALLAVDLQTRIWLFDQGDMSLKVYDDFGYLKYFITNTDRDGFLFQEPQWMSVSRDNRLLLLDTAVPVLRAFDLNTLP